MRATDETQWELEMTQHLAEHDLIGLAREQGTPSTRSPWPSVAILASSALVLLVAGWCAAWWLI